MSHYPYLIVGGGMAAAAAVQGIREIDPSSTIGVIGREHHPPYQRPPLSKALWKGKSQERIWIATESQGTDFHLGRMAQALDQDGAGGGSQLGAQKQPLDSELLLCIVERRPHRRHGNLMARQEGTQHMALDQV